MTEKSIDRQTDVDKYTYADMQTCQFSLLGRLSAIWKITHFYACAPRRPTPLTVAPFGEMVKQMTLKVQHCHRVLGISF